MPQPAPPGMDHFSILTGPSLHELAGTGIQLGVIALSSEFKLLFGLYRWNFSHDVECTCRIQSLGEEVLKALPLEPDFLLVWKSTLTGFNSSSETPPFDLAMSSNKSADALPPSLKLTIIPFKLIDTATNTAKSHGVEQTTYNTLKHSHDEISAVLPTITHVAPVDPPTYFGPWLEVIASSQGIQPASIHRIVLSPTYVSILLHASKLGLWMNRISESDAEDLELLFPKQTTGGIPTADLFDPPASVPPRQYFLRLDVCSPKDGFQGTLPVTSAKDVYTRIATSPRAMTGIRELQSTDPPTPITLYLLPFNPSITPTHEYRVFCPPHHGAEISAISQYRWWDTYYIANEEKARRVARIILNGAQRILVEIKRSEGWRIWGERLEEEGFIFDVRYSEEENSGHNDGAETGDANDEGKEVQLIELNPCGAMSKAGCCLFHWIRDAEALYGIKNEIDFRITM